MMPRARRCPRIARDEYALSPRTASGRGGGGRRDERHAGAPSAAGTSASRRPAHCQQRDQREAVAIDELVDLRRQAAAGAADRVITRLDARIRVIRSSPLSGASCSSRADPHERSWNPPTATNPPAPPRPRRQSAPRAPCPTCLPWPCGDARSTRSATAPTRPADPAPIPVDDALDHQARDSVTLIWPRDVALVWPMLRRAGVFMSV